MINEKNFRFKRNGKPYCNCFCKDFTKIENYSKAILDTTQIWDCHHRRETHYLKNSVWIERDEDLTYKQLIEEGVYYNVPPEELIFLTRAEHNAIHNKGKNRKDQSKKILCIETGKVFDSAWEAQRQTGISQGNISKACRGKLKTTGGFHWKFYAP